MPPNGGFGGNTGIHDAHNLAWKLALVLERRAGPALLDTYEAERKPVGKFTVEQAYTRYVTRTAPYLGAKDFEPPANDFNIELGYLYRSPAILAENGERTGARRPAPDVRPARLARSASVAGARRQAGFDHRPRPAARSCCLPGPTATPGAAQRAARPQRSTESSSNALRGSAPTCAIRMAASAEAYGLRDRALR